MATITSDWLSWLSTCLLEGRWPWKKSAPDKCAPLSVSHSHTQTHPLLIFIESRPVYTTTNTARFCCLWAFCLQENNARSARISKLWKSGSSVKSLTFPCKQEGHFSVKTMSTAQPLLAMLQCHHSLWGGLDTFAKLHNFRVSLFRLHFVLWCSFYRFGNAVIVNLFWLIFPSSALTLSGSRGGSTMVRVLWRCSPQLPLSI